MKNPSGIYEPLSAEGKKLGNRPALGSEKSVAEMLGAFKGENEKCLNNKAPVGLTESNKKANASESPTHPCAGAESSIDQHSNENQSDSGAIKKQAGIKASYKNVLKQAPEMQEIRYDVDSGQFVDGDNHEFDDESFRGVASLIRAKGVAVEDDAGVKRRNGVPTTAGSTTLKRAVLTHTFLRGTSEERSKLLEEMGSERLSPNLTKILYSLDSNETRSQGGFSASEVGKKCFFKR